MATSYSCYAFTILIKQDTNIITLYQVSSSIHKNDFIPKESLFHKLFFMYIVKAHRIRHASSQHAFLRACIINHILKKAYAGLRVKLSSAFWGKQVYFYNVGMVVLV